MRRWFLAIAATLLLSPAGPAKADGDVVRGRKIYERCQGCHSIDRNRAGPRHRGLFGHRTPVASELPTTDPNLTDHRACLP